MLQMDMHNGGNGGNMQAMVTSNYFIIFQAALLGVSDYCVKKLNICPIPMNIHF